MILILFWASAVQLESWDNSLLMHVWVLGVDIVCSGPVEIKQNKFSKKQFLLIFNNIVHLSVSSQGTSFKARASSFEI